MFDTMAPARMVPPTPAHYIRRVIGRNVAPGEGYVQHVWVWSEVQGHLLDSTVNDAVMLAWFREGRKTDA
jgi:hypothetical protein